MQPMTRHQVFIDCDPGIDDCIALFVALGSPDEIALLGVGTVAGNVPVERCASNAAGAVALAARSNVPVYAGCPQPLQSVAAFAEHVHGESGLGSAVLPSAAWHPTQHAVDALCALLATAESNSITLVVTGPMTNIGVAFVRSPQVFAAVKQIVIMGGAHLAGGNITPHAEFNIYADPHAADIVLRSGLPIVMVGLDATLQVRCTAARMAKMKDSTHRVTRIAAAMVDHVNEVYGEIYGSDGAALHDPCTVGYLLAPELFRWRPARVTVDTSAGERRGHTRLEWTDDDPQSANVEWVTDIDDESLFALLLERMERL